TGEQKRSDFLPLRQSAESWDASPETSCAGQKTRGVTLPRPGGHICRSDHDDCIAVLSPEGVRNLWDRSRPQHTIVHAVPVRDRLTRQHRIIAPTAAEGDERV